MPQKRKNKNAAGRRATAWAATLLCLCAGVNLSAHVSTAPEENDQKKTRVYLLHADVAKADEAQLPGVQVLVGNVKFRHDSMYMFCDSAHVYEKTNSFKAFDRVHMEQGDTLFIDGDYLFYNGESMIAELRHNVTMINRNTTLRTDSLNYDRLANLGYYFDGGSLEDERNVLVSDWGQYSPQTKVAVFNHDVKLTNDRMDLYSDTLKYSTVTKVATLLGPSNIYSDENHIYSERGFYNTNTEQAELLDRSVLTNNAKKLIGDSLFYDRQRGYGEAFSHVVMNDTLNRNMLTGDYCYYNERKDSAFVTLNAVAIDYGHGDTLFAHADTMMMVTRNLATDSLYREMLAFHKVRSFRNDVQMICDSLAYSTKDSCLSLFYEPVLWHGNQQILGERIDVFMNDSALEWAHVYNQSLSVEHVDSTFYNQVSGKEMKAYFDGGGNIRQVDVIGNVLTIYYPMESDSTLLFMNTAETSLLNIYIKERKVDSMKMSPKSNGVSYPMTQRPEDKRFLKSFVWLDDLRPKSKNDIFTWKGKREEDKLKEKETREIKLPTRHLKENE